jgi:hypothetical protein
MSRQRVMKYASERPHASPAWPQAGPPAGKGLGAKKSPRPVIRVGAGVHLAAATFAHDPLSTRRPRERAAQRVNHVLGGGGVTCRDNYLIAAGEHQVVGIKVRYTGTGTGILRSIPTNSPLVL